MSWRAWDVAAVAGLGVVAGAFLLPQSSPNALQRAATRTVELRSIRTTLRERGGHGSITAFTRSATPAETEDYVAPDRVRLVLHSSRGSRTELITIGRTIYSAFSCTEGSHTDRGFVRHRLPRVALNASNAVAALSSLRFVNNVQRGTVSAHGAVYSFSPVSRASSNRKISVRLVTGAALVQGGFVRALNLRYRYSYEGHTAVRTIGHRFSRFNRVPPIRPPAADQMISRAKGASFCNFGTLSLAGSGR
jgi:hypothetical protein